jgi:hypothetical protein
MAMVHRLRRGLGYGHGACCYRGGGATQQLRAVGCEGQESVSIRHFAASPRSTFDMAQLLRRLLMYEGRGMPRVRVLHTSPDAPAVDIFVDDMPAIAGLSFGQLSSYAELPSGAHNVKVFPAGMGPGGTAVIDPAVDVEPGVDYTVAAVGTVANIQAKVLKDSTPMPGSGMAKVRVFHASPDAPAVDVGVPGGPVLFEGITFKEATSFEEVDAGVVDLEIRPSGGMEPVMVIPGVSLDAGNAYTFVALGMLVGTPSFRVMPIIDRILVAVPS